MTKEEYRQLLVLLGKFLTIARDAVEEAPPEVDEHGLLPAAEMTYAFVNATRIHTFPGESEVNPHDLPD